MKRILAALGATLVGLAIGTGAWFIYMGFQGKGLDVSGRAYVDEAVPKITGMWSVRELLGRCDPAFCNKVGADALGAGFKDIDSKLGILVEYEGSTGGSQVTFSGNASRTVTALYDARAKYTRGDAVIHIRLSRDAGQWQIADFVVDAPVLRGEDSSAAALQSFGKKKGDEDEHFRWPMK